MKFPSLALIAAALLATGAAWAVPPVSVAIDATRPGAHIDKHLYGQAAGDLGNGIDGGIWVGPASRVPNIRGWRTDVVGALRQLHVPVLRWPGGCGADVYDWRDGIGPRAQRPLRLNGAARQTNAVGTDEFFDLVELLGADAYINGNVGTGSPREAAQWVEYMMAEGGSRLAQLRAKNGHPRPYKVRFFGVGNAPWGCGGNMTPEYYADLYNQFAVFIRGKSDHPPGLVASGDGAAWTDELSMKKRVRDYRDAISAHPSPAAPARADEDRWIPALNRAAQMNAFIDSNVAMLDKNDTAHKASLVIGTWGERAGQAPQTALRDALVAALHFHAFHAHAGRLSMANIAPAGNSALSMILIDKGKMVLTPTYYAFKMHVPFQDATSLPVRLADNPQYAAGGIGIATVSASAARATDGKLYLSLVNTNPEQPVAVAVAVTGAVATGASGSVLTAGAVDAYNSAASPDVVAPAPLVARAEQGKLLLTLAPGSVTVLAIATESQP